MSLSPGGKLGPYEILALIGAGGMGEVYRGPRSPPQPRRRHQSLARTLLRPLRARSPRRRRLVAYSSNESGRYEVRVQTFPLSDRTWQVSTNGGYEPRWRGDGREIYYLAEDRKLMAVSVGPGPSFGVPKPLFQTRVLSGVSSLRTSYVPSRDGRRFLVNTQTSDPPPNPITVVLNWTAGLRR